MANAWRILDIVLALGTMAVAAMMLDAATNLTSNGLTLLGLLMLSAIPLVCAITARVIRAWVTKQERAWRVVAVDAWILLFHPLVIAAVFLPAYYFDWALNARFELSRASLENSAQETISRPNVARNAPGWIGLYWIEAVRVHPGGRILSSSVIAACLRRATSSSMQQPIAPQGAGPKTGHWIRTGAGSCTTTSELGADRYLTRTHTSIAGTDQIASSLQPVSAFMSLPI